MFELFGASPRSVGLAGAMSAGASGGEAAFHNPAMLGGATLGSAWFGGSATGFQLNIQLQRPLCTDSWQVCSAQHLAGFAARPPQLPKDSQGFQFGWSYPLGGVLRDKVTLGAGLALPYGRLIRISGADPQTPNFVQYEGMPDRLAFLFAAAWRVTDRWWLGVGTQVLAVLNANLELNANVTNRDFDSAAVRIGLSPHASLTAGTTLHPTDHLWLGLSWRQKLSLTYAIPTSLDLGAAAAVQIGLGHETLFTPDTFHAGASWRRGDWLLLGDLGWARWSQAPDPSPYVRVTSSGPLVDGFGLDKALQVGTDTPPIQLQYRDVWQPSLAVERTLGDLRVRAGAQYRPTPAPRATGAFNYLDNDALVLGLGTGWRFGQHDAGSQVRLQRQDDPEGPPAPWRVDVGVQLLQLRNRTVHKDDPNDPMGDVQHGGWLWHASASLGASF